METLKIHSHLAHFRLIARISGVSSEGIRGEADFNGAPLYAGLEAMAQLAALHVRQHLGFERHAFLLKVHHCRMPAMDLLKGCFRMAADVRGRSRHAFHYAAIAQGPRGVDFKSELLIGTRDYDDFFPEDMIKSHYQRIWAELKAY